MPLEVPADGASFTDVNNTTPVATGNDSNSPTSTAVPVEPATPETALLGEEEVKPVVPEPPKTFKVKVSGEEKEVQFTDLERAYQRLGGIDKRLSEAKAQEERVNKALEFLESNPLTKAILGGQDPLQIAEQLVYQRMQEERLPPEQRAVLQAQRRLAEMGQQIQHMEQKKWELEQEAQANQLAAKFDPLLAEQFKTYGIPANSFLAEQAIQALVASIRDYGPDSVDVAEVVKVAHEKFIEVVSKTLAAYDPDKLIGWLGDEAALKLSKAYAKKLQARPRVVPPLSPAETVKDDEPKYVDEKEFEKEMKKFRNRG